MVARFHFCFPSSCHLNWIFEACSGTEPKASAPVQGLQAFLCKVDKVKTILSFDCQAKTQVEGYCISTFRGVTSFIHTVERRILLLGTVYLHLRTTSISAFSVFALIEASFFCCSDMRFVTNRYLTPSKPSPHKW